MHNESLLRVCSKILCQLSRYMGNGQNRTVHGHQNFEWYNLPIYLSLELYQQRKYVW